MTSHIKIINKAFLIIIILSLFTYKNFNISSFLNFLFVILAFYKICIYGIYKNFITYISIFFVFIIFHCYFTLETVDIKNTLNFLVFILSAIIISNKKIVEFNITRYNIYTVVFILFFLLLIFNHVYLFSVDHFYQKVKNTIGISKQSQGIFLIVFTSYVYYAYLDSKIKSFEFFLVLILIILYGIGIHTLIVSLFLTFLAIRIPKKVIFYFIGICLFSLYIYVMFFHEFIPTFLLYDIRGIMINETFNIAKEFPLGLGFGSIDEYFNSKNLYSGDYKIYGDGFDHFRHDIKIVMIESDFLLLISYFGIYFTFLFYFFIFWYIFYLERYDLTFSRFLIFLNLTFLASGLFQDNLNSLIFWYVVILNISFFYGLRTYEFKKNYNC